MKYFFTIVATIFITTNCSQEELVQQDSKQSVNQFIATIESGSRSVVSDAGLFSWTLGDAISVWDGSDNEFKTITYSGSGNSFNSTEEINPQDYAIYPAANHVYNNGGLFVYMPDTYGDVETEYKPDTHAPMLALINQTNTSNLSFNHLGGVMRFLVKNVPVGANGFKLSANGKKLHGTFNVDQTSSEPFIKTGDEASYSIVSILFKPLTTPQDMVFYVPVPVGTYPLKSITIQVGSNSFSYSCSNGENEIKRRSLLLMPTLEVTENNGSYKLAKEGGANSTSVALENTSQDFAINENTENVVVEVPSESDVTAVLNLHYTPKDDGTSDLTISDGKTGASADSKAQVVVTTPAGSKVDELNIDAPTLTVNLASGEYTTVKAKTATETLIINSGVIINTLEHLGGKVIAKVGAKIGNTTYDVETTLYGETSETEISTKEQLLAAFSTGGTYRLTSSFTPDVALTVAEDVALDLNGFALTLLNDNTITISSDKTLTLINNGGDDGKITGNGDILTASANANIYIGKNVKLESSANCCIFVPKGAENVNIETAGNLYTERGDYATLYVNGDVKSGTIGIMGGSIKHGSNTAVYAAGKVDLTIDGNAVIEGTTTGVEIRAGHLIVNNGEIKGNGNPFSADSNGNGSTSTGAAVAVCQHTTNEPLYATINGGTFTGVRALYEEDLEDESDTDKIAMKVNGGTFNGEVKSENCQNFIYGGTYTDPSAFSYLAADSDIKLGANIVLAEAVEVASGQNITLDLNGYSISQKKAQTAAYAMILNKGALTIKDSSSEGTGKISYADITEYSADINYASNTIRNEGTLTLKSGTVENISDDNVMSYGFPHAIDVYQGSTTNIEGGTVKSENYDCIRMFCNSTTKATTVNISGGKIINRVTFQNPSSNQAGYGVLNITGGTFTASVNANVRLLNFSSNMTQMKAEISGGTFDKGVKTQNYASGTSVSLADWLSIKNNVSIIEVQ